jgi:hypothetical protein
MKLSDSETVQDPKVVQPAESALIHSDQRSWSQRWESWSARFGTRSKAITKEVQGACEEAVGRAREQGTVWSRRRERSRCMRDLGEQVYSARVELTNHLPAAALSEIARVERIDEELSRLQQERQAGTDEVL